MTNAHPRDRQFGPVRFLPGEKGGRYPYCHSLYIEDARIIVDPASNPKLLGEIGKKNGVAAIWLSHWHEDHFTYLDIFDGRPIYISAADEPPLTDIEVLLDWYGLHGTYRDFWRREIEGTFHYRPRPMAGHLKGGTVTLSGGLKVEIIPTPGHTPGHLALYFTELAVIFLGDYDLTPFGPWYGDRHSSIEETLASLDKLESLPASVLLTGHEQGIYESPEPELWRRYRQVIFKREEKLIDFLQTPRSLDDIVRACIVYGKPREPKEFFEFGERAIMEKHLGRLLRRDAIFINEKGLFERRA